MLTLFILASILASFIFAFGNYRKTKISHVKPCIEPTPIPKSHYVSYYFDWGILVAIVVGFYYLLKYCL